MLLHTRCPFYSILLAFDPGRDLVSKCFRVGLPTNKRTVAQSNLYVAECNHKQLCTVKMDSMRIGKVGK